MDDWEVEHIRVNGPALIASTTPNANVVAILQAHNILSPEESEQLNALQETKGKSAAASLLYKLLATRMGAYQAISIATFNSNQSGAYFILLEGLVKNVLRSSAITLDDKVIQDILERHSTSPDSLELFQNDQYKILRLCTIVDSKTALYIPRHISNRVKVDRNVFKQNCPDIFVFTGLSRPELTQLAYPNSTTDSHTMIQTNNATSRFVLLNFDEDWDDICKICVLPTHLIRFDNVSNEYILELTSGISKTIQSYVNQSHQDGSLYISEDTFCEGIDKYQNGTCICDLPGMGKTWLLKNIFRILQQKYPARHVVFLNLPHFISTNIEVVSTPIQDRSQAVKYLVNYLTSNALTSAIFEHLLSSPAIKVELLVDGFDEITFDHVEWTKNFFRTLAGESTGLRLIVASRLHMRRELEETFMVKAFDILPFSEQNQIDFLVAYWKENGKISTKDHKKLEEFGKLCLKHWKEKITKKEGDIMGRPLQCQLLANVNKSCAELYCQRGTLLNAYQFVTISSMYNMYKMCLEMNIEKALGEWRSIDATLNFASLKAFHVFMALQQLFPELAKEFHQSENLTELIPQQHHIACGLLTNQSASNIDSKSFVFFHQTFAEFLVAEYFAEVITGRKLVTPAPLLKLISTIVVNVLGTQAIARSDYKNNWVLAGVTARKFKHEVLSYFFNAGLEKADWSGMPAEAPGYFVNLLTGSKASELLFASIESQSSYIISLLKVILSKAKVDNVKELRDLLTVPNSSYCYASRPSDYMLSCYAFLWFASKFSSVVVIAELYGLFEDCFKENLDDVCSEIKIDMMSPLQFAVKRQDYDLVEFFMKRTSCAQLDLLQECVKESKWFSVAEVKNAVSICELLIRYSNKEQLLYNFFTDAAFPVKELNIHVELLKIIVSQVANNKSLSQHCKLILCLKELDVQDFNEIWGHLLSHHKAFHLLRPTEPGWRDPLPEIVGKMEISTLRLVLDVPGRKLDGLDKYGNNLILTGIKQGCTLDVVQELKEAGVSIAGKNNCRQGALHLAAAAGKVEIAAFLVGSKLELEDKDVEGNTPLLLASRPEMVEYLVSQQVDVMATNRKENNSAHLAAEGGEDTLLAYLLELPCAPDMFKHVNDEGKTPLHIRLMRQPFKLDVKIFQRILETSDIHLNTVVGKKQENVFLLAVRCGYAVDVLRVLTRFKADATVVNSAGDTALHLAAENESVEVLDYVRSLGLSMERENMLGEVPLHKAHKSRLMLNYFEEKNANFLAVDALGNNVAHKAANHGNAAVILTLLKTRHASVLFGARNKLDITPLQCIFSQSFFPSSKVMEAICGIADISLPEENANGVLIYHHAVLTSRNVYTLELLEMTGVDPCRIDTNARNALHLAAGAGSIEVVKHLVSIGLPLEDKDSGGNTPLLSSTPGNAEVTKYLISKNANILSVDNYGQNFAHKVRREIDTWLDFLSHHPKGFDILRQRDRHGRTPLHEWIYTGVFLNAASIEQILKLSRDNINDTDETGRTILLTAVLKRRRVDLLKTLLSLGADANQADLLGRNALHHAATSKHVHVAQCLLPYIQNRDARDNKEHTPLLLAKDFAMIKFLIDEHVNILAVDSGGNNIAHKAIAVPDIDFDDTVKLLARKAPILFTMENLNGETPLNEWLNSYKISYANKMALEGIAGCQQECQEDEDIEELLLNIETSLEKLEKLHLFKEANDLSKSAECAAEYDDTPNKPLYDLLQDSLTEDEFIQSFQHVPSDSQIRESDGRQLVARCSPQLFSNAAAKLTNIERLKQLIKWGADPRPVGRFRRSALHWASARGNLTLVKYIASLGLPLEQPDEIGCTPFLLSFKNLKVLKFFISIKANVHAVDVNGENMAHYAICGDFIPLVDYLLRRREAGALFAAGNNAGQNPFLTWLSTATQEEDKYFPRIQSLGGNAIRTLLNFSKHLFPKAVSVNVGLNQLEFLRKNGADIFERDDFQLTALHWAAINGNLETTKYLVSLGLPLNDTDKDGRTPLTLSFRNIQVLKYLVSEGADIMASSRHGYNIAHNAFQGDLGSIVECLLRLHKARALFGAGDAATLSPLLAWLYTAEKENDEGIFEKVQDLPEDAIKTIIAYSKNVFPRAVSSGLGVRYLRFLVAHGAKVGETDGEASGMNALHFAVLKGCLETVKYVVSLGLSLEATDEDGNTPLLLSYTNPGVTKYLIQKKACTLQANAEGKTIAHLVILGELKSGVEYLLELPEASQLFGGRHTSSPLPVLSWLLGATKENEVEILEKIRKIPQEKMQMILNFSKGIFPLAVAYKLSLRKLQFLLQLGADAHEVTQDGRNALHMAALMGDVEMLNFLLTLGLALEERDKYGNTPLLLSGTKGEAVMYLLQQKANMSAVNNIGNNMAHMLAQSINSRNWLDRMRPLSYIANSEGQHLFQTTNLEGLTPALVWVSSGDKLEDETFVRSIMQVFNFDSNRYGKKALLLAAESGKLETTKYLINEGVPVNAGEAGKTTPLLKAVGHLEMVEFLISQNANVLTVDCLAENVAHKAALYGRDEVVDHLLCLADAVPLFTQVNSEGRTPLYYLFTQDRFSNSLYNLLNRPDIFLPTEKSGGDKLFIHAVQKRQTVRLLQTLHKAGADVNAVNKYGQNVLHLAAIFGDFDYTTYFLSVGVSMETRDKDGSTPLHLSTRNVKVMECLIDNNADILAVDKYGDNIAHKAKEVDRFVARMCKHRLKNEVLQGVNHKGETPLHKWLASNANLKSLTVQRAFLPGTNINAVDSEGRSAFLSAVSSGRGVKILNLLLLLGSDLRMLDKYGQSALHLAADNEDLATVKFLVSKDTTHLNTQDEEGCTPIMLAAGNLQTVQYLITQNANYLIADYEGNNIAHIAINAEFDMFDELISYLLSLEHGHNLFKTANIYGRIPLHEWLRDGQNCNLLSTTVASILDVPGINVNGSDEFKENMFLSALRAGQPTEVLKVLLKFGVNHNDHNVDGDNALHCVIFSRDSDINTIPYLLSINCNPAHINEDGETPLVLASSWQRFHRTMQKLAGNIHTHLLQ